MNGTGRPMVEHALLPAPTLTKVVDRLVSAGLVYRRVDAADRRRVLVFLSEHGRERVAGLTTAVEAEWARVQESVGREELALLRALLTRISVHLP